MDNKERGLYDKYLVQRTDEKDNEGKHTNCEYFVLDLTHDPYAIPALQAYSAACKTEFPGLAADLRVKALEMEGRNVFRS